MLDVTLENEDGEYRQFDRAWYVTVSNNKEYIEIAFKPSGHDKTAKALYDNSKWTITSVYNNGLWE